MDSLFSLHSVSILCQLTLCLPSGPVVWRVAGVYSWRAPILVCGSSPGAWESEVVRELRDCARVQKDNSPQSRFSTVAIANDTKRKSGLRSQPPAPRPRLTTPRKRKNPDGTKIPARKNENPDYAENERRKTRLLRRAITIKTDKHDTRIGTRSSRFHGRGV